MRLPRAFTVTAIAVALISSGAWGADLLSLYREANNQDPAVAAALASLQAARERVAQAEAANGFNAGLAAGATANYGETHLRGVPGRSDRGYQTASVSVQVNKPLIRPGNDIAIEQAQAAVKSYEIALEAAQMDIATRVSQAYFDVLLAQDNLTLVRSQKAAVNEQLAMAKRNFEVGTATIVDTNEAQSKYDQVLAQEIAATNELNRTIWVLRNVVGRYEENLKRLNELALIPQPSPNNMEAWVTRAENDAYGVRIALQNLAIAEYGIRAAEAGKKWTLDAVASVAHNQTTSPSAGSPQGYWGNSGMVGINFNLPFDVSGGISARVREALANVDKSRNDLEASRRLAGLNVRQSFLGLTSGIAGIAAQEQALKSAQTLLESTKLGLEVGVRTNLDVLNAQQALTQVQRDLASARYNTLLNEIRLKAAAGVLTEDDIRKTNALLRD